MADDLETRVDGAIAKAVKGTFSFVGHYAWDVADKTFRLLSWTLLIGVLAALQRKTGNETLHVAIITLVILVVLATLAVTFSAALHLQDSVLDRWVIGKKDTTLIRMAVGLCTIVVILFPLLYIVLPFLSSVFFTLLQALEIR